MYLTRPKSSKGRSRPAVNSPSYSGKESPPESPVCSGSRSRSSSSQGVRRPDRTLRSQSQPVMYPASQLSQDQVLHMLQHTPAAPPQSLNKYKVLPSIERRPSEASLEKKLSKLNLSDDSNTCSSSEYKSPEEQLKVWSRSPEEAPVATKGADTHGSLLLAIRAPCGRRFLQHFDPTDSLQIVKASAEHKYETSYQEASIETMDMPRRTFTDLNATLAQCGIVNRSVLCISRNGGREEEQEGM